jgi:Family of unknown function (DUF6130)
MPSTWWLSRPAGSCRHEQKRRRHRHWRRLAGRGSRPTDGGLRSWDPALVQRSECREPAYQDACRSRGWHRARHERLRPEREGDPRRFTVRRHRERARTQADCGSPLSGPLAQGIFQAQYRVENVRIVPVFGAGAVDVSPRLGHLHITVDDLPWWWADASDNNTIDIAGLPPGEHKVKIELVDANHNVFPGQVVTLTFTVPGHDKMSHEGRGRN